MAGRDAASTTFPYPPGPRGTVPPEYAALRETDPVARVRLLDGSYVWLVTRYDDVQRVLTDPVFSRHRAAVSPGTGFGRGQGSGIVDVDGPAHDRYRLPVEAGFDARRVRRWRPRIEEIAAEELVALADGPLPADLVRGYTAPIAGRVTCEFLGLAGEDWRQLTADVEAQLHAPAEADATGDQAPDRARATLTGLLEERRRRPADDVATTLLGRGGPEELAGPEGAGTPLTDDDRLILLQGLVVSGFIGIRDLLARHVFAVLADPSLSSRLRTDPAAIAGAVEELLRCYPSSNDGLLRVATRDVVLGTTLVPAGAAVLPLICAASRDPKYFPEPDLIDVDRVADRGIAFGSGPHACPAADLARTVLAVGIGVLLARFPEVRLAVPADDVEHHSNLIPLGIRELFVHLGRPSRSFDPDRHPLSSGL